MFFLTSVICLGLFALFQWLWERRGLYLLSWQLPGPFALPLVGNFLALMNHYNNLNIFTKFTARYGSMYRFWLGTKLYVIVSNATDIETILQSPHCIDKDDSYRFFEEGFATVGLFTIQNQKWKRHRRLITPSFNARSVNLYIPIFNRRLKEFVKSLSPKVGLEHFDIRSTSIFVFIQMILDTTIGYNNKKEDLSVYSKFLADGQVMAAKRYFNPFYQFDFIWQLTKYPTLAKNIKEYRENLFEQIIKERSSVSDDEKTLFLDRLLKISEENSDFTMEDVKGEGNTAIMAGSDTSTGSLAMVIFMLAMHPQYQEKLYDELNAIFPNKDVDVTSADLNKLLYLDMCIKESLRLFPTVSVIARKTTDKIELGGYTIPTGTSLGIDIFNLHRSRNYWGDTSDKFIPERFDSDKKLPHPYCYMAFSHGPRNCIGYRYALVAMKLALAYMLLNYRFTTSLKMSDLHYYSEINIIIKEKLMVQIHNR